MIHRGLFAAPLIYCINRKMAVPAEVTRGNIAAPRIAPHSSEIATHRYGTAMAAAIEERKRKVRRPAGQGQEPVAQLHLKNSAAAIANNTTAVATLRMRKVFR